MKWIIAVAVAVAVLHVASCKDSRVTVEVGDKYKYPLDKVRVLWKLLENERDPKEPKEPIRPRFPKPKVCYRTDLPSDFRPLCDNPAAWMYLERLVDLATQSNSCEICETAACYGC